jgi:hypothetical protein
MCLELFVLIDESDVCSKDDAVSAIAMHLAYEQAKLRGLFQPDRPQVWAEFIAERVAEIETKLRRIVAVGPP